MSSYKTGVYGYGRGYYIVIAWELGCALAALLIILLRCRKIKNKKMGWLPFAAYGVAAAYSIAYYLDLPFWKIVSKDMTATLCLLFALIIESCIQSGLILQYRICTVICSIYHFGTDHRPEWKMHLSVSGF